jgi:hypothetical protein
VLYTAFIHKNDVTMQQRFCKGVALGIVWEKKDSGKFWEGAAWGIRESSRTF